MTIKSKIAVSAAAVAILGSLGATAIAAQPADNTRPGWGYGDKNHVHVGPPGQSVNVGNSNNSR